MRVKVEDAKEGATGGGEAASESLARHVSIAPEEIAGVLAEVDVVVEFGCTDGRRLKTFKALFPNKIFIGFDEQTLVEIGDADPRGVVFLSDWDLLMGIVQAERSKGKRACLLASSPVQGVFTRMTDRDSRRFQETAWNEGFELVAHRNPPVVR